jgi:Phage head-tail joining protein
MNTGALRHHVTLDVPDGATGGYLPLSPPDWWCAQQTEAMGQAILIGRFHPGITTATRVHFRGKTYHVDSIINREERDAELVLSVREVFD